MSQKPLADNEKSSYGAADVAKADPAGVGKGAAAAVNEEFNKRTSFCERWVVGSDQLSTMEDPAGALMCARVFRTVLIVFIAAATASLISSFIFKHSLPAGGAVSMTQKSELPAPSVMICPSPWGTKFKKFEVNAFELGAVPGNDFHTLTFEDKGVDTMAGCHHLLLSTMLKPHGTLGEYTSFDTVRLSFKAESEDGSYNFGFTSSDNPVPQAWSYASLNTRTTGRIGNDELTIGGNDIFPGSPRSSLSFEGTGSTKSSGSGRTELEYFYRYFMVRSLSGEDKGMTVFALVTFILLLAAAVNNCGMFDLFFVEYEDERPQLEPNIVLRYTLGRCFASCRRRKDLESDAEGEA